MGSAYPLARWVELTAWTYPLARWVELTSLATAVVAGSAAVGWRTPAPAAREVDAVLFVVGEEGGERREIHLGLLLLLHKLCMSRD